MKEVFGFPNEYLTSIRLLPFQAREKKQNGLRRIFKTPKITLALCLFATDGVNTENER